MLKIVLDVLSTPAILVGLIAMVGLILQKKPVSDIIKGTIKTILGFVVLAGGAGIIVASLSHLGSMFQAGFKDQGVIPNNEAIVALALKTYGTRVALVMFFGMVANMIIARVTPLKYIFLTGHHTLYMACLISVILAVCGLHGVLLIVVGAIILGFVMALFPAIASPVMKRIIGSDDVALGHFGTTGYIISALVGKLVGKGSRSTEDITFPKTLGFFRDSSVSISITMAFFFVVIALVAGRVFIEENLSGGQNYIVFAIIQGITFAAGVYIVLQGVRLIIGEIVPAFVGISEKLLPHAKPALDCPVVFPYAPNAVMIGFLSSFIGGIIGLVICGYCNLILILPGIIPHFFCGGTAGVFGNATGGIRGAVFGAFVHGLIITFLPILLLSVLGDLGFSNTTFGDTDFAIVGILLGKGIKLFM
jgi:PTS system ascorbate-specific IIC component